MTRFGPGAEQVELANGVRDLLSRECPPPVVRAAWTDPDAVRPLWSQLAKMGVLGLLVPEDLGGVGLDETFLVPVLTELGRAAAPGPLVETVGVAAQLLAAAGLHDELAGVLAGSTQVAVDLDAGTGDDLVPYAVTAGLLVLPAPDGQLALHRSDQVRVRPVSTLDATRRAGTVRRSGPGQPLAADPAQVARARETGAVGTAAFLLGLSAAMLDLTTAYVRERKQFGVAVGSFQAIKHQLADALVRLELARPCVHAAALSLAAGSPDAAVDVSIAKSVTSDAAEHIARTALQCHGAIAYTVEYDYHLYAKRAWALARSWGSADQHRDRIATRLRLAGAVGGRPS